MQNVLHKFDDKNCKLNWIYLLDFCSVPTLLPRWTSASFPSIVDEASFEWKCIICKTRVAKGKWHKEVSFIKNISINIKWNILKQCCIICKIRVAKGKWHKEMSFIRYELIKRHLYNDTSLNDNDASLSKPESQKTKRWVLSADV